MSLVIGFIELITKNPKYKGLKPTNCECLSLFFLPKPFPMKLNLFIEHFLYQLGLTEDILAHCYILIEDILNSELISEHNIHRIIFTAFSISYKFTINSWISNNSLERIGRIKKGELVHLEAQLLSFLNWKLKFKKCGDVYNRLKTASIVQEEKKYETDSSDEERINFVDQFSHTFSELEAFFAFE